MSVAELAAYVQKSATHHPLMWRGAAVFLAITLVLGFMHDGKIVGEISIVLVRQFKHQAAELIEVGKRLKKELTTWDEPKTDCDVQITSASSTPKGKAVRLRDNRAGDRPKIAEEVSP
jgi:hypothetical protein